MPEYPEIACRAAEMQQVLPGLQITQVEIYQNKCLNLPEEAFTQAVCGLTFEEIHSHGKWLLAEMDRGVLALNLGMGGEVFYHVPGEPVPPKKRVVLAFNNQAQLSINFWWFGYFHYVNDGALQHHSMLSSLGPDIMQIPLETFIQMLTSSRQRIKTLLLDQKKIAGIGNYYIHDILFKARIHPLRPAQSCSQEEMVRLYQGIREELTDAFRKGGSSYEYNLWGKTGNYQTADLLVGYKEGQPCPVCQTEIVKINTVLPAVLFARTAR